MRRERTEQDLIFSRKIELIRSFMQVEGNVTLIDTNFNYDSKGGVQFSGYKKDGRDYKSVKIVLDKSEVEFINDCKSIPELYECYREMEFFPDPLLLEPDYTSINEIVAREA